MRRRLPGAPSAGPRTNFESLIGHRRRPKYGRGEEDSYCRQKITYGSKKQFRGRILGRFWGGIRLWKAVARQIAGSSESRSEDEFGVVGGVDIGGGRVCASRTAHGIEEEKRKTLEENSRKHLRRVFP